MKRLSAQPGPVFPQFLGFEAIFDIYGPSLGRDIWEKPELAGGLVWRAKLKNIL